MQKRIPSVGAAVVSVAVAVWSPSTFAEEPAIVLGGVTEIEASNSSEEGSNIAVATFELGMAARINDRVTSEIVFLYEEGDTPFEVDAATVNIAMSDEFGITAGLTVIPFGVFESYMLSDPLTLELAETGATVVQADFGRGPWLLSAYTFNGANEDDDIDNFGLNFGYGSGPVVATLGYLTNMGDTDTIAAEVIDRSVPGLSASVAITLGEIGLIGEHITALDDFSAGDGNDDYQFTGKAQPSASALELGYSFGSTTFAVGFQSTKDAEDLGLAEQRVMASVSRLLLEQTSLALEYADNEGYDGESEDVVTAQLAVEF